MKNEKVVICDWGGVVESHRDVYSVFQSSIDLIKLYTNEYSDNDEIYLKVQEALKVNPKNILLIDDTKENIETAKRLGWNTCQATGNDLNLIKETVNNFIK